MEKRKEQYVLTKPHKIRVVKTRTILIGLLALVALALPMYAAAGDVAPLKGSEAGTFQLLGPCAAGGIGLEVTGAGHATLLGSYTGEYRECFNPANGAVTNGTFTLTASNGDKLFGTYAGQAVPSGTNVLYDDPGVITGGTGRFSGASGTANTSGVANLATGEYQGTLSGNVTAPASA